MTIDELDKLDLNKLTEDQVIEAFRRDLRCYQRFMELDGNTDDCRETAEQREERMDAAYILETMRSNYIASFVK